MQRVDWGCRARHARDAPWLHVANRGEVSADPVFHNLGQSAGIGGDYGTPAARASSAERPKLSVSEGSINKSLTSNGSMGFLILPMLTTSARTPGLRRVSRRGSPGPSPTSSNFAGCFERTAANTSTTSSTRLTGRKFEMRDDRLSIWGYRSTELFVGISFKMGRADKVMNHFNFLINPEQFQRVAFEAVRYSRHRIGFVDGVGNDRFECGVFPSRVMSVPCNVVTMGTLMPSLARMSRAVIAALAWGMA